MNKQDENLQVQYAQKVTMMHPRRHFLMFDSHVFHLQKDFNLTVRMSESHLTSGELTYEDVEHLPLLCTFLNAENGTRDLSRDIAGIQEETHKNGSKCVCVCTRACAHIPAQSLVLLLLQVSGEITSNQERCLSLRAVTPSNMTELPLSNATPPRGNSSCASPPIFLEHAGTAAVKLQAQAQVSPQNKSLMSCEKGNGEPSPDAKAKLTWQPGTAEGPVPRLASNGEGSFSNAKSVQMEMFRKTLWSSELLSA